MCDKVKLLNGTYVPHTIKTQSGDLALNPVDIANTLGRYWSNSNNNNFSSQFLTKKQNTQQSIKIIYILPYRAKLIEKEITYLELLNTLNSLKGNSPGFDKISYPIIKKNYLTQENISFVKYTT